MGEWFYYGFKMQSNDDVATITVKRIPGKLYDRLRQSAKLHHRSINSEVIVCLERALLSERVSADAVLTRARQLRRGDANATLDLSELNEARISGRP